MSNQETKNAPEISQKKKISFFSAMLIVVGGSIGAGIFFKSESVLSNSQSSLILAIFSWILASFAIICMALALIEIASVKNDNLSLISWAKIFTNRTLYNATKNFMTYIYLPLTYFFMPLYVFLPLQDGLGALINTDASPAVIGTQVDWLIWLIIALVLTVYFLTIPAFFSKVGDVQNKIVLSIKFIPLLFVALIGFVLAFSGHGGLQDVKAGIVIPSDGELTPVAGATLSQVSGMGAFFGIFLSLTAIFFAYDGFYVAAGISSEMKQPKKTPLAIFLGLGVTTIIYVVIAISMSINGGSFTNMREQMISLFGGAGNQAAVKAGNTIYGLINIFIAIGVLGIINGFSMWAPRFVEDLIAQGELPYWQKFFRKLNSNKPKVGSLYSIAISIPIVVLFFIIGAYGYYPTVSYYDVYGGVTMHKLYSFADLMSNWTALFTFGFISFAIFGALLNKKTNKIKINQTVKGFKFFAATSVALIWLALSMQVIEPFANIFSLAVLQKEGNPNYTSAVVSRVMTIVVLFIFIGLSFGPSIIEDKLHIKKYGSLANWEAEKSRILATAQV
ncbi:APC family permease [Mycoplasmopsis columbinasalis]|uniref:Serine/threonine exchanger SteT n=1 Tax=Mycoplasmopsis columbinasalis TaxID=114880 RepID=A0A449BAZ1_9BACT|nr:APC family permease [Mycoplasmopsis columbinasalis]VEU78351.1 Serine/threonine exchanger SteT [Mycoplasmopsis columbinasalis]